MKTASYQFGGLPVGGNQTTGIPQSIRASRTDKKKTESVLRKNNQNQRPKKHLNYNPREIRNNLALAKDSQSAGRVVCTAKAKLTSLLKCKGTGMYQERELSNAIVHARRMVYCAQMKNRNLRKEEQLQKRYAKQSEAEEKQHKEEVKRKVRQKRRVIEQKVKMEKLQQVRRKKQHEEELIRRRRMNRLAEKSRMDEADQEYKSNMNRGSGEGNSVADYYKVPLPVDGIELELSGNALELSEQQMEQQAEQMLQAELGTMEGTAVMPDLSSFSIPEGSVDNIGAEAPAVDVVV